MTDSEHLIENMLVALERGKTYDEIMADKLNAVNATAMTMDTAWEVSQYIYYEYMPRMLQLLRTESERLRKQISGRARFQENEKLEAENELLKTELKKYQRQSGGEQPRDFMETCDNGSQTVLKTII